MKNYICLKTILLLFVGDVSSKINRDPLYIKNVNIMNAASFVANLTNFVIEENNSLYRELFNNTTSESCTDEYWIKTLDFFNRLNEKDRETLFGIMRQTAVDTTSSILGVLDGTTYFGEEGCEFELYSIDKKSEVTCGDLQDIFLQMEEK